MLVTLKMLRNSLKSINSLLGNLSTFFKKFSQASPVNSRLFPPAALILLTNKDLILSLAYLHQEISLLQ